MPVRESSTKMMKIGKNEKENGVNFSLNDGKMQKVETYRYLGVDISSDGGMDVDVNHRITEAKKSWGALKTCGKRGIYLERQK